MRRHILYTDSARRRPRRFWLTRAVAVLAVASACAQAEEKAMERIPLDLLMNTEHRTPEDIRRAAESAAALGIEITSQGRASLSGRISPEAFERLFGAGVLPLPADPPGDADAGRPPGYAATAPLPVPPDLEDLVTQITIPPPARRL
jgi:hypothetical protein